MASSDTVNKETEVVYKTKIVNFLNRSVPIILQNDNGPCPLLAICNVLLLRNQIQLSLDATEVASSRLLDLVAERLLDSNSNIENKDEEYARNQQQNISDALSLLHDLATGLNVNVRFRNIHDFEFTPQCAVFDLLDIGLVHGWLCDPQDEVTSNILGGNSYNVLMDKLVKLQTSKPDLRAIASTDSIDFMASTTATLGVPSPSRAVLLKTKSFEGSGGLEDGEYRQRKGDAEENVQLLEALMLSSVEMSSAAADLEAGSSTATSSEQTTQALGSHLTEGLTLLAGSESSPLKNKEEWCVIPRDEEIKNLGLVEGTNLQAKQLVNSSEGHGMTDSFVTVGGVEEYGLGKAVERSNPVAAGENDSITLCPAKDAVDVPEAQDMFAPNGKPVMGVTELHNGQGAAHSEALQDDIDPGLELRMPDSNSDLSVTANSLSASSEPLYEGEAEASGYGGEAEDSGYGGREPLYEGEAKLTEQTGIIEEGEIISNFFNNNASQLTYYGLFCLQEGLKERELSVFFRNNHFSTMFKYKGDLYLLVTDQGYLSQPDIVWEKLDEVHGDTVLVTGNFTPFQADGSTGLWDEQGTIAATADYLSSQQQLSDGRAMDTNADLELAMSLQHQEFEKEQQPRTTPALPSQRPRMDTTVRTDSNRLITGPKNRPYKPEAKTDAKSKCGIM